MKLGDKIEWMKNWAKSRNAKLSLDGRCGMSWDCVGIIANDAYPDYFWYDADRERADPNGDVWTPAKAYHQHPCLAVLGHGDDSTNMLYEWLVWFNNNGFELVQDTLALDKFSDIELFFGKHKIARMVKQSVKK